MGRAISSPTYIGLDLGYSFRLWLNLGLLLNGQDLSLYTSMLSMTPHILGRGLNGPDN